MDKDIRTPQQTEKQQINHSGNLDPSMREVPYQEGRGPLQEEILITPDAPNTDIISTVTAETPVEKNTKRRGLVLGGIGLGAVAAVAGAVTAFNIFTGPNDSANPDNAPIPNDPKATSEATPETPEETEAPVALENNQVTEHDPIVTPENRAELIESLRISASATPEEKVEKIVEVANRWTMAGATPELFATLMKGFEEGNGVDSTALAEETARNNADAYAEAIFGEDWQDNPLARDLVASSIKANAESLDRYLRTYGDSENPNTNSKNKQAYEQSLTNPVFTDYANADGAPTHLTENLYERAVATFGDEGLELILFTAIQENNAESNMYADNPTYAEQNGTLYYLNGVLAPDGKGNVIIRYLGSNDNQTYDVPY